MSRRRYSYQIHSLPEKNWQDLDLFDTNEWESTKDQTHYKKVVEDDHIYEFLVGLNGDFNEVRSRELGKNPLLSINEVYFEVCKEESYYIVMLGKKPISTIETSTMVVQATANKAST